MLWPKRNSYEEFDNEKKFLRLENSPPPPNNLSNGPSLSQWKITLGKEEIYPRGDGNRLSATFPWREKNNPPSH